MKKNLIHSISVLFIISMFFLTACSSSSLSLDKNLDNKKITETGVDRFSGCSENVQAIGSACLIEHTGYEFELGTNRCVEVKVLGCDLQSPFKSKFECENRCVNKNLKNNISN